MEAGRLIYERAKTVGDGRRDTEGVILDMAERLCATHDNMLFNSFPNDELNKSLAHKS